MSYELEKSPKRDQIQRSQNKWQKKETEHHNILAMIKKGKGFQVNVTRWSMIGLQRNIMKYI